jgi:putative ABC transport system substrate-binding protein
LVSSINRPTGNVTGVTFNFTVLGAKRSELLHEMVPKAGVVAVLVAPDSATSVLEGRQVEEVARTNGQQVLIFSGRTPSDIQSAFANSIEQHAGSAFFGQEREQIVTLAARHSLPAMYYEREFVVAGGLMSYGAPLRYNYHQAGVYVGQLLKGAKPSDLPVVQGTKIELVINLKTAKQLNLSVPLMMQMTADEVIE